ncbi:hypothetical protein, partial [Bartonella raoultii]|uniref:hypothetical protein n=1 Tax=Bartonella raoultii TaxID=1457020 RepID=UPI001ABBB09F
QHVASEANFFANEFFNKNVVMRIFTLHFPPPVASALALVFRESKTLNSNQHFAFSAGKHLDIAKSPGIPGHPHQ